MVVNRMNHMCLNHHNTSEYNATNNTCKITETQVNGTRNTDLNPMPFFPMYPVLTPFFVEFPTSQRALMLLNEKPCSLFNTTMPFSSRMNVRVGSTFSG